MTPAEALDWCNAELRAKDRDRWLAVLWAKATARPGLTALFALDLALWRVVATTTDPRLGEIRLAWWRERLEALDTGAAPAEPVLVALKAQIIPRLGGAALAGLEDGPLAALAGNHGAARRRGLGLFGLAAHWLGTAPPAGLGLAWAQGEAARAGEPPDPAALLPPPRVPRALRPLLALDRLGARDCRRAAHALPAEPRATLARQWLMARSLLIG